MPRGMPALWKPDVIKWEGSNIKKFFLYLLRWQLSTPVLAGVLILLNDYPVAIATIGANLIGGIIFFWFDRWIFKGG
jgi:hypothetical protein